MCIYCKKLKEIKELEKKQYETIIKAWKNRDYNARSIIRNLAQLQIFDIKTQKEILTEANEFLNCNYVE